MSVARIRKERIFEKTKDFAAKFENAIVFSKKSLPTSILEGIKNTCGDKIQFVFGKGGVIRKALKTLATHVEFAEKVRDNVGVAFTNLPLAEAKKLIEGPQIVSAAKVGQISQCDYYLPAGPTGIEIGATSMFQALDIATKVVSSQLTLASDTLVLSKGKRVNKAQVNLLNVFNIMPFIFRASAITAGLALNSEKQQVFSAEYLNVNQDSVVSSVADALKELSAISFACGLVNEFTVRKHVADALGECVGISAATECPIEEAKKAIEGGKAAAAVVKEEKVEEKVAEEPAEEEEESADLGGLFD